MYFVNENNSVINRIPLTNANTGTNTNNNTQ